MRVSSSIALLLVGDGAFSPSSLSALSVLQIPNSSEISLRPYGHLLPSVTGGALNHTHKGKTITQPRRTQLPSIDEKSVQIPRILYPWIYSYRAIPKVVLPSTNLDVSFAIVSAIIFTCIDFIVAELLYKTGWPNGSEPDAKQTRAMAGSLTTILHSASLVPSLGACLMTHKFRPSAKMADAPQWWQDAAHALIQFCTGYMIYDAAVQFIADKWVSGVGPVLSVSDWLFLGHHAATSLYMTSARIMEAGHVSAMILMCGGEFTAPFQNAYRISRIVTRLVEGNHLMHVLHPYITYVWAVLYAFFRIAIGPACAIHLTQDLVFTKEGRMNVPLRLSLVWLTMCWGVLIGSIPWINSALDIIRHGVSD
jgi:hypothetical protein